LSQCNSQIILKILNPNDQNYIRQTVETLAMADLLALPDLSQGEALLSGAMIPVPSLVKIRRRQSLEGIPARDRLQELTELSELI
jgi:DNA helicase HerA-like ATPase